MQCDTCLKENLEKPAIIYCQDCNELLCQQCKDHHTRSELKSTHKLCDVHNFPCQQDRKFLENLKSCSCRGENKEFIEYFCKIHDVLCCRECVVDNHLKCGQHVDKIGDLVAKGENERSNSIFEIMETKVKELTDMASNNAELAEDSYNAVEKRLDEVKDAIDEAFNELKTKVLGAAKSRKQGLINRIQQQKQNIETLSMELNEHRAIVETVSKYGTDIDKHIFDHLMETSSLKEIISTESSIRSSLMPRQVTTKEKHSVADIVKKLKDAIDVIDKELITGSDSHDGPGHVRSVVRQKMTLCAMLSGPEQFRRMKKGTRVVRGPDWRFGDRVDGGEGGKGTVVDVYRNRARVRWDHSGEACSCKMGYDGQYELQLAD